MNRNQLDKNIAVNLKRIRKSENLSLDALAQRTGVSKSMLGQIERGESNPTITTLAKIVNGLRVSFEELVYQKMESVAVIDNQKLPLYKSKQGGYQIRSIFPYDSHRKFELYKVEIEPGESCESFLPEDNNCEYIMIEQGALTLETQEGIYDVADNHVIRMTAGNRHSYHNKGVQKLVMTVLAECAGARAVR